jgi:hypothetical protein
VWVPENKQHKFKGDILNKASFRERTFLLLKASLLMMLGLVLLTAVAYGQGTQGIVGTVTDPSGAAVPNAKVTITNVDNNFVRSTVTSSTGNFSAPDLQIGHYTIKVEADKFKTAIKAGITINVATLSRQDVALELGQKVDSVTVEAQAIQVQSDTSYVSSTVTDNQITNLATNGRSLLALTALVAGAATNMPDFAKPVAQYQNRDLYFNGQRADHNNWVIDGAEAYDRGGGGIFIVSPSQDSIAEFKVITSNFGPDLGNSSGGMVTMALKQGTTKYHGSAWEYNRNDALSAYNWVQKQLPEKDRKMQKLRYNTFGFNLGGPVPLGKEKKTFFFYNMEWRRYIVGDQNINNRTLLPQNYNGDMNSLITDPSGKLYSASTPALRVPYTEDKALQKKFTDAGWALSTKDPATNKITYATVPNNTIPSSLFNANALVFLAQGNVPKANSADGMNYMTTANTTEMYREESVRLDHQFSDKLTVFGHLIWDNGTETLPRALWGGNSYPTVGSTASVPSWSGVVHATYTISPTLLNEVAFTTNGNNLNLNIAGNWQQPTGWTSKQLFAQANADNKMPQIVINSPGGFQINYDPARMPWNNTWRSYTWKDDVSWARGAHNIKFGGNYMFTMKMQPTDENMGGSWNFSGNGTGVGFADFLLGLGGSFSQPMYRQTVHIANHNLSLYLNDDWKVSRRLTLNLGLRWEYMPHSYDQNGALSNFYPDLYDPAQAATFVPGTKFGLLDPTGNGFRAVPQSPIQNTTFYMNGIGLAGVNGIPRGLTDNSWKTFAPRVGFAYDVTGKGLVLRGGFGMFYERIQGNEQYNMMKNVPFAYSQSRNNVYLDTMMIFIIT